MKKVETKKWMNDFREKNYIYGVDNNEEFMNYMKAVYALEYLIIQVPIENKKRKALLLKIHTIIENYNVKKQTQKYNL